MLTSTATVEQNPATAKDKESKSLDKPNENYLEYQSIWDESNEDFLVTPEYFESYDPAVMYVTV